MTGPRWLRQLIDRFRRDQRGNAAIVFGLAALPLAAGAGLAIDSLMAYSVEDQLQKSLDAAGLAAGRTALPENVETDARSYFNTNFQAGPGLATLQDLKIEVSEAGDQLTLSASAAMPTRFMRLFGHDTVTVTASTVIDRTVRQMELALVLDNTGSMWGAAFDAMQAAAKDLVDIVYGSVDTNPNLYVAVVPFVSNVNIGSARTSWLDVKDPVRVGPNPYAPSTWKGCVMGRTGGLDQTDDPPSVAPFKSFLYPKAADNDWGAPRSPATDERLGAQNNAYGPNLGCGPPILPLAQKKSDVIAALNGMGAWSRGGTAGNEGLAWGWRVLSPRWRGVWGGVTPNTRPLDYATADTDKVAVVLTDGDNQVYDWPCQWQTGKSAPDCSKTYTGPNGSDYTGFGRLFDFMGSGSTIAKGKTEFDKRMTNICTSMKKNGIIIYTITFGSTPSASAKALYSACATRPEYYYHSPDNATLRTVFRSIGVQLSNLRIAK
jgi:Flp pilus assembly protein TadG